MNQKKHHKLMDLVHYQNVQQQQDILVDGLQINLERNRIECSFIVHIIKRSLNIIIL